MVSRHSSQMDPERDPEVARLLDAVSDRPSRPRPREEDTLRSRIVAAAEDRLAGRAGRGAAWWAPLAVWTRPALPIGAAACLALVMGLVVIEPPRGEESDEESAEAVPVETSPNVAESWATDFSAEAADPAAELLSAQSSSDFLTAVLEYPLNSGSGTEQ